LQWLNDIRQYGHLKADVYPLYKPEINNAPDFDFNAYGFTDADLESLPADIVSEALGSKFDNALDAARYLEQLDTRYHYSCSRFHIIAVFRHIIMSNPEYFFYLAGNLIEQLHICPDIKQRYRQCCR